MHAIQSADVLMHSYEGPKQDLLAFQLYHNLPLYWVRPQQAWTVSAWCYTDLAPVLPIMSSTDTDLAANSLLEVVLCWSKSQNLTGMGLLMMTRLSLSHTLCVPQYTSPWVGYTCQADKTTMHMTTWEWSWWPDAAILSVRQQPYAQLNPLHSCKGPSQDTCVSVIVHSFTEHMSSPSVRSV